MNRYQAKAWLATPSQNLSPRNLDAEPFQPHIMPLAGGQQADGGDAEVFQDLRAKADFQPFSRTGRASA